MNLFSEQTAAIKKLRNLKAGALFMEPGTGKTRVALELAKDRQEYYEVLIWVAPACLLREETYLAEIERWRGGLTRQIAYFSVEGISASDRKFLELVDLATKFKTFIILDESITIKNTESGRTKRLLEHYHLFTFRLILNGTPVTKGLMDLYSQMQFISPKVLKMSEAQFANNFLTFQEDGYKPWKRWSRPENEAALVEIIRPYVFDSKLDFNKEVENKDINCFLSEEEQAEYCELKNLYLEGMLDAYFLPMVSKFQHFYTCCSEKYVELMNLVKQLDGAKAIIYVKFLDEVEALECHLPNCCIYTGPLKEDLNQFKEDKQFLICTYGVGSLGLNLQFCHNIIYFSQTFDYAHKEQSLHRIKRTGQKESLNIYNLYVNTGLEKIIKMSLDKKQDTLLNLKHFIEENGIAKL